MPRGTYTEWHWPGPPAASGRRGFPDFEHTLVVELDPGPRSTYFWSHQFGLVDGEGGYLGLQTTGNRVDGSVGKTAIFSVWKALEAEGPATMAFEGEGEGYSCRIPYEWEAGRPYRLRVATAAPSWWEATVADEATGESTLIGRVRVAPQWGGLGSWSVMWTEFFGGAISRCSDLPHSRVLFGTPTADAGTVIPGPGVPRLGTGTCDNSRVEPTEDGWRHEMGRPA